MSDSGNKKGPGEETTTIELLSTTVLRQMLNEDEITIADLEATALSETDGCLGRDENGAFAMLEKTSLDSLMNESRGPVQRPSRSRNAKPEFGYATPPQDPTPPAQQRPPAEQPRSAANVRQIELEVPDDGEELELVDTQMLRVILDEQLVSQGKEKKFTIEKDENANPYDSAAGAQSARSMKDELHRANEYNPYKSSGPVKKK
ncbi:MAG: hypothetical protein AAGH76_10495 [Pseudomonadota bacterium]